MRDLKFVGLHAHSGVGSPFDGFGYPQEHMDYAYKNGCEALALTDHGNTISTVSDSIKKTTLMAMVKTIGKEETPENGEL